jgi:hypothetical protein
MLDLVETSVVVNYDIDVILPVNSYVEAYNKISSNECDVVYPYGSGQYQIRVYQNFNRDLFHQNFDINQINNNYDTWVAVVGHCFFISTDKYKECGAENENFIAYGPEDVERFERFQKYNYKIERVNNLVFHFEHFRKEFSNSLNPHFKYNEDLLDEIRKMNTDELKNYYSNIEYLSKYKTFLKKNINIITICTGKYTIFFEDFYKSCEKFFLKNYVKKYFVFTDGDIIQNEKIIKINQSKLGWPYDTMMRFKMFNSIENILNGEYVFFFNVNMIFVDYIDDDIIPKEENDYLMGVCHPGYINTDKNHLPYERNPNSNLYIPFGDGSYYFQGCFNGGRKKEFIEMSKILSEKIELDLSNRIIPVWHDESALNWYFNKKNTLRLEPSYAYPESFENGSEFEKEIIKMFHKKIIQIDKNKLGGHSFLRS